MTDYALRGAAGRAPAIWNPDIPPKNKNFTGRESIFDRLRRGTDSKVTAVLAEAKQENPLPKAVQGMGGVGKTAVAIEYAYRYASDYDVVWWIPADQLPLVRSSLAALAGRLGLDAAANAGIDGAAAAAVDALRLGEPYRRWLLIFDNADEPEVFRKFIPYGPGDVLITSRNPRWEATIDTVSLDVFSRAESTEFLRKRVPDGLSAAAADMLADKLGDLPLALDQAGAMLAETRMPVDDYVRLLDAQFSKIMSEGKSAEYGTSVTAAWTVSVTRVRDQLPEALNLLRCCAFFGADPIPRDVFSSGVQAADIRMNALMSDPILFSRAVRELGRFALVTLSSRGIAVHRLIQALLRDELDEEEQLAYRHDVHLILAAAAPASSSDELQWQRYHELLPHVASEATQLAQCRDESVRTFVLNVIRYLYLIGDLSSCTALAPAFIEQWTRDSGPDNMHVLEAQREYGNVLRQLGHYSDAYEVTAKALTQSRAAFDAHDPTRIRIQMSFAADQRTRGNFTEALTMDRESLDLNQSVFGPEHPQSLRALHNVALDLGLTGNYRNAVEQFDLAYRLENAAKEGISPTDKLIALYNLAWALRLLGRYQSAADVSAEAWDYGKSRLGADHYATLRAGNGHSIALRRIEPLREAALQIAEEIWAMARHRFGDTHPEAMATAVNLVNIQRTNGLVQEALELASWTAEEYPKVYGPEHPYTYGCIGNHGLMLRVTGNPEAARVRNMEALAGLDSRVGRDHDYFLVVALNLASDLAAVGDVKAALALGEDTHARLMKLLGADHPLTLGCAINLALDLRADGAAEEAARLTDEALKHYSRTLGSGHPDALAGAEGRRIDFDFDPPPL
jgi:tetratricopeptide (TPR) repeat protein